LFSAAGLNTGLFVCAESNGAPLPDTLVKIEDGSGFCGKVRIAGKDPASMFSGPKGVAAEPAPQSSVADLSDTNHTHLLTLSNMLLQPMSQAKENKEDGKPLADVCTQMHAEDLVEVLTA
jgi:hypothetical protein